MSKGGFFLLEGLRPQEVFTPEDFTDEHRMIASMTNDFVNNEVVVHNADLEEKKPGLMRSLLQKAGELGLLSAEVPEENGGEDLDKVSACLINENLTACGSFAIAQSDHVGFCIAPITYFGNDDQKTKYLPEMATGNKIGAYALTEPAAGSDALGIKTKAVLSADGSHYILNGAKQFITNAGIADVFIVYAKVDGDKFTAFIVDKDTPGLSLGPEEKKMGIKGSSTCSVVLEDAKVPVQNVLFAVGKGHIVAFDSLNIGRFKLGAQSVGTAKQALNQAAKYAQEREQFGKPVAKFGMIQEKFANMATAIYIAESAVYRLAGLIDQSREQVEKGSPDAIKLLEEYVAECSINKVYATEVCSMVADEAVQIYGGYGYSHEYMVEQIYRDSRINRLFEGTNEINRLIVSRSLLRKAINGEFPLIPAAEQLAQEILSPASNLPEQGSDPLSAQHKAVEGAKKLFLLISGAVLQKYKDDLDSEQEILRILADLIIEIYAMESGLLRALKSVERDGIDNASLKVDMVQSYFNQAMQKIEGLGREAFAAMETGEGLAARLATLKNIICYTPVNGVAAKRRIADRVLSANGYVA